MALQPSPKRKCIFISSKNSVANFDYFRWPTRWVCLASSPWEFYSPLKRLLEFMPSSRAGNDSEEMLPRARYRWAGLRLPTRKRSLVVLWVGHRASEGQRRRPTHTYIGSLLLIFYSGTFFVGFRLAWYMKSKN